MISIFNVILTTMLKYELKSIGFEKYNENQNIVDEIDKRIKLN